MERTRLDAAELLAHAAWVRRVAQALARDADEADELVQETWSAALQRSLPAPQDLRAWLGGVVRRVAHLRRRGESRREARERAAARAESVADTHELVARARLQRELVDAVLALEQPYRDTLLLRYFDECSPSEIAARQGASVATVKSRLQRGLAKLRAQLDQRHAGRDGWLGVAVALALVRRPLEVWLVKSKFALVAALVLVGIVATWVWNSRRESAAPEAAALQRSTATASAEHAADDAASANESARDSARVRGAEHEPAPLALESATSASATTLRGRVVSLAREALGEVEVEVRHSVRHGRPQWEELDERESDVLARIRSDSAGEFTFELGRRASVDLWIAPSGGWSGALSQARRGGEFVELVLSPAGSLAGEVTLTTTGAAVADAAVELVAREQLPGAPRPHTTRTDALGRYRLEGVEAGAYWLHVTPRDARPERYAPLELRSAEHRVHDVAVEPGVVVRGRIVDARTRLPVAGAVVADDHVRRTPEVRSDANGRFELRGMDDGTFGHNSLLVRASGYAPLTFHWTGSGLGNREVAMELSPGRRVHGRVLDADGTPRESAFVALLALTAVGSANEYERRSARSDANGRFELRDLRSDVHYTLLVQDSTSGELVVELPASDALDEDLGDLRLPAACALRGVVVDERGAPLPWEALELHGPSGAGAPSPQGLNALLAAQRHTRSDSLGRFAFENLGPGAYVLSTRSHTAAAPTQRKIELSAGQSLVDLRFELPQQRELFGHLVDARGAPVARAFVALYPDDGGARRLAWQLTDNDGSFRFRGLPEQRCALFVWPGAQAGASVWLRGLEPSDQPLLVVAPAADELRGVVRTQGEPRVGVTVEAFEPGEARMCADRATTDRDGRFALHLRPGSYEFVVRERDDELLRLARTTSESGEFVLEAP